MTDMTQLSERTESLIQRITESMITAGEKVMTGAEQVVQISTDAALQRIDAAVSLAEFKATLQLRVAQLDAIGRQKDQIEKLRAVCKTDSLLRLYDFQIGILTAQEVGILDAAGVPESRAKAVIVEVDEKLYLRDGRRFVPADAKAS